MSSTEIDLVMKQKLLREQYEAAQAYNRFHLRELKKLKEEVIGKQTELAARRQAINADPEYQQLAAGATYHMDSRLAENGISLQRLNKASPHYQIFVERSDTHQRGQPQAGS